MQTKLLNWAKETYQTYSALVNKYSDIAFYNQTPLGDLQEPVKVVVMGNNPCSEGSFSDMKKNVNWGFDKLGEEEYRHLIRGNVFWQERTEWCYWCITMRLLSHVYPGIKENEAKECVFTNAAFFNTLKAEELDKYTGLYKDTLPCTLKLIEILSPEMVLNLAPNNFNRLRGMLRSDFDREEVFDRSLMLGRYKGILFVGIYHPSSRQSNDYKDLVRKSLVLIREKRESSIKEIASQLKESYGEEWDKIKNRKK